MKKIIFLFVVCLTSISAFAMTNPEDLHNSQNQLTIAIDYNNTESTTLEHGFKTVEELYSFDVEDELNRILSSSNFDDFCTASITVTVRVGINSSFAEASVTVEGVSCDKIASEIKRLKAELKAALQ